METISQCADRLGSLGLSAGPGGISTNSAPPLQCLNGLIPLLINLAFVFLGALSLFFLMFGAIKFITANGDAKAVKTARDTMTYAVVGTILVIATFVIANLFAKTILPNSTIFNFRIGP